MKHLKLFCCLAFLSVLLCACVKHSEPPVSSTAQTTAYTELCTGSAAQCTENPARQTEAEFSGGIFVQTEKNVPSAAQPGKAVSETGFACTTAPTRMLTTFGSARSVSSAEKPTARVPAPHTDKAIQTAAASMTAASSASVPASASSGASAGHIVQATSPSTDASSAQQEFVHVKVDCSTAVSCGVPDLPADGILVLQDVPFSSGMSVLDALRIALQQQNIGADISHGYVKGIAGLSEKDCGGTSGWLYSVNGEYPFTSCDKYRPNTGDQILFRYTVSYGDLPE